MLAQRGTNTNIRSIFNPNTGELVQYSINQDTIHRWNFVENSSQQVKLPFPLRHVIPFGDQWLFIDYAASSSTSSYLFHHDQLSRIQYKLDTIGLANSGGQWNQNSIWFATANDYLAKVIDQNRDSLTIERFKRTKPVSSGDVPPQETYEKRRLQTFINRENSLLASFYGKNEIDPKLL